MLGRSSVILSIWRLVQQLDRADLPLLRRIPDQQKRRLVRQLFRILPSAFPGSAINIGEKTITLPGSETAKLQYITLQKAIAMQLTSILRTGMTVADVGANAGFHTVLAAQLVGETGCVHAVEPHHETIASLRSNIRQSRLTNVHIHACAAGAVNEERIFYVRARNGATNSLFQMHPMHEVTASYKVRVVPLDELIEGSVDVAKIDVEGGELEVLEGMKRLLNEKRPLHLIIEWSPELQQQTGHHPTALPEYLIKHGFQLSTLGLLGIILDDVEDLNGVLPQVISLPDRMIDLYAYRSS